MTQCGCFITIEGLEGAGKSSCLSQIERLLRDRGLDPLLTREPGGTPLGEAVRGLLLAPAHHGMSAEAETLLLFAARAQHLEQVIRPALQAGRPVVCDRFTDATYAYQGGGRQLGEARIAVLEDWVQQGLQPDLTLYLDVPPRLGLERARQRSAPDRFEQERLEFFERARAVYLRRAERFPVRMKVIDASRPLAEVQAEIAAVITRMLDDGLD
ncbi:MAG: dTMP kinase [Xanthomonadaceae bacterium]|nr:dTMP kinase [Xanthomonadaceae bacterium]